MPQHFPRFVPFRRRCSRLPAALVAVGAVALLTGCGSNSERPIPAATTPAVSSLTAPQIVTEAQRALSPASAVHVTGQYRENNKPVSLDMRILAGKKATGT